ncbi:hypothetical protein [Streptomyces sp. NBC_01481]|uniref:alpha-L-rhamnosidase-related protein n=1 Tax=Streptomyces sp. NBC_01481 TaxID=2975869 RepID=UPI0022508281|nr:hypothetical protein [Streptomyces sp. NBC_01481]MCX4588139.1 hypothetical protein [Streptomyces sp. NBC_01481]
MIVPFTLWQPYGDVKVVRDHYVEMAAWIDCLEAHSSGLIRPADGYGDWLDIDHCTPLDLIGTAYFAESTAMMAQMARALDKSYDAMRYLALWADIRDAFHTRFVGAEGQVGNGSQTSYVLRSRLPLGARRTHQGRGQQDGRRHQGAREGTFVLRATMLGNPRRPSSCPRPPATR